MRHTGSCFVDLRYAADMSDTNYTHLLVTAWDVKFCSRIFFWYFNILVDISLNHVMTRMQNVAQFLFLLHTRILWSNYYVRTAGQQLLHQWWINNSENPEVSLFFWIILVDTVISKCDVLRIESWMFWGLLFEVFGFSIPF